MHLSEHIYQSATFQCTKDSAIASREFVSESCGVSGAAVARRTSLFRTVWRTWNNAAYRKRKLKD
jgi:hypothetical protein